MTDQQPEELPNSDNAPANDGVVYPIAAQPAAQSKKSGLSSTKVLLMLVGILAIVGLTIGGTLAIQGMLNPENTAQEPSPTNDVTQNDASELTDEQLLEVREALLNLPRRDVNDPLALGSVDAPIVLISYADYRCPHCIHFASETFPEIVTEYVESGKLRIEWRDLPILGEQSVAAAFAARAAANQDRYWEYHDALVSHMNADGATQFTMDFFLQLANDVGIADLAKFEADISSEETLALVQTDYVEATQILGFQSTPSFVLGGVFFSGSQPMDVFRQAIEHELELAEQ